MISILATISLIVVIAWLLLALFQPHQKYTIAGTIPPPGSDEFFRVLENVTDAKVVGGNRIQVLANGENFYEAELRAIREAQSSVHLEAYIFESGEIAQRFLDALVECAKNGIKVRVVVDAVGALTTRKNFFQPLIEAGGKMSFYHPLNWYQWDRYNHRTHREILVVDGKIGFIGGAGVADHWHKGEKRHPRWRDTMARVEGPVVGHMQSTFIENWLEASGELLVDAELYPKIKEPGKSPALVVNSPAGASKSTRARMLFQTLIAAARSTVYLQTPYFLPDVSFRNELIRAARRGVSVKVINPGHRTDHALTRSASRRLYGELIENGIEIYEYQPAMMHVKALMIDGEWSVIGSTNTDNRSFELNDEVNLASYDGQMTQELTEQFVEDLRHSKRITYDEWKRRPLWERTTESFGRLIERQQ
jgi:cardiolipin synthase